MIEISVKIYTRGNHVFTVEGRAGEIWGAILTEPFPEFKIAPNDRKIKIQSTAVIAVEET